MSDLIVDCNSVDNTMNSIVTDKAGIQDDLSSSSQERIPINVTYDDNIIRNGNSITVQEGSQIHIEFEPIGESEPGEELYLYLRNLTSNPSFKADINLAGKYIRLRDKNNEWYYHNDFDYLVQVQETAGSGKIDITFQEAGVYTLDSIELVENSVGNFEDKYNSLKADTLKDVSIDDNMMSGNITINEGKWMFVSLPYSDGWSCNIDGKKTNIVKANYSFMAVFVPEGNHEIVFSYITPGIKVGAIISAISLILFLIAIISEKFVRNNEIKNTK